MVTGHCTHSWIGSFAAHLILLRPRTSLATAVHCAVASFHHAAEIPPLRAVEIYLFSLSCVPAAFEAPASRGVGGRRASAASLKRSRRVAASFA